MSILVARPPSKKPGFSQSLHSHQVGGKNPVSGRSRTIEIKDECGAQQFWWDRRDVD
ncbi:MAG: hypothetical protein HC849_13945 [Oscillatoriales cyanobacterium RU_3_3]|nr:hypothetical protein [Oscillatoriales cyanobacterium RU_3_3]